ncbi:hypothetical protein D9K80_12265 [Acinetobacter cumulans]|jgi:hypothetical protein|uniref:Uncharacterized protein n=1 Tax=Acinetobacter cumulans TaxID=2136182 RepID=A0A498CUC6_9GAMM|nr:hypothetical protein [Acinetobacter cumulans]RKG47767.1 hypothetical protein D7V68_10305 [Acinetobacter cumulans]RLL33788.1 hypothetical protein D9K80_12265 [Acinetobacter cumulans]
MKKIILLLGICILGISLIVYFFRPNSNTHTAPEQISKVGTTQRESITADTSDQTENHSNDSAHQSVAPSGKAKKLSEEATLYYKVAYTYGWEAIVRDFENGTIAKSKMPDDEKKKLCELALTGTTVEQTKRLFTATCKPLNGKISFRIINGQLKDAEGKIDQTEMIHKLKFLQAEDFFQSEGMYKFGPYEEKFNLQSNAIAWGLEEVSDYLLSIGIGYAGNSDNLINSNIQGRNPSISLVKKLMQAGIHPNAKTYTLIEERNFASKHPELYLFLQEKKQN